MTLATILACLVLLTFSVLSQETSNSTNAPITQNNPTRVTFQAVLQVNKPVQGQITGVSDDNGTGVNFNVNFFKFPDISVGPFSKSSQTHSQIRLRAILVPCRGLIT